MANTPLGRFRSHVASVFHDHGPLLLLLSWLLYTLTFIRVTNLWLWLPKRVPVLRVALDDNWQKAKPWWQDIGIGLVLMASFLTIPLAWSGARLAPLAWGFAAFLIYDILGYLLRVVWLDDVGFSSPPKTTRVWSHRRSLFIATLAYAQSVFVFPVLYHQLPTWSLCQYSPLLSESFAAATAFSIPPRSGVLGAMQVAVSLFYLAVIISTMASTSYRRQDIASDP